MKDEVKICVICKKEYHKVDFRHIFQRMKTCGKIECKKRLNVIMTVAYKRRLPRKKVMKIYRVCENQFTPEVNNMIYCSLKCREIWYANQMTLKQIISKRSKVCKICNKQFQAGKISSRTCSSDCSSKLYVKENFDKVRQVERKRRARLNNIIEIYTLREIVDKRSILNGVCPKCENYVGDKKLTLDHIYPIAKAKKGRIYTIHDIQFLCRSCNCSKQAKVEV